MVKWELFKGSIAEWDALVVSAQDSNPMQLSAWGTFKQASGWIPARHIGVDGSNKVVSCAQTLVKKLPTGGRLAWIAGGPLLGFPSEESVGEISNALHDALKNEFGISYLRIRPVLPLTPESSYTMEKFFSQPYFRVDSGYTIHFNLAKSLDEINAAFTSKHRYYVKRSLSESIEWHFGQDDRLYTDFASIYSEVIKTKNFSGIPPAEIGGLLKLFSKKCFIGAGYKADKILSGCALIVTGTKATYFVAATNQEGRKLSAAYGMIPKTFEFLKGLGVTTFDFCGIAPADPSAAGVNHFKRGFGGEMIKHLGEWEKASLAYKTAINAYVRLRNLK